MKPLIKSLLFSLLLSVFSIQLFASVQVLTSKFEGSWRLYNGEIGKIDPKVKTKPSEQFLSFKDDGSYVLKQHDQSYTGVWYVSDDDSFLYMQRAGALKARKYEVIRTGEKEFVIKDAIRAYYFISTTVQSSFFSRFRGVLGIIVLILILYLISSDRKKIDWRIPASGILIQVVIAFAVLKVNIVHMVFEGVGKFFTQLLAFTREGSLFLFGGLIEKVDSIGYIFAFQVLPTVVFFSALTSLLYYFGILQFVVKIFAWVMQKAMRLSGAESLAAAANIFIGQTEAPLVIKPYLHKMTRSEIMALMTGGMATIAGGVLAAYIGFLGGTDPEQQRLFATHLLTASIMNAPASLFIAKILVPQTETIDKKLNVSKEVIGSNVLDAISRGTIDGLRLAVNVGGMLLVFIALMALLNHILFSWIGQPTHLNEVIVRITDGNYEGLNMQFLLGMIFSPIAWLIGIPVADINMVGQMLGEKTILNEFYAFVTLGHLKDSLMLVNEKSIIITTYALCGFANFSSIGIQIGGISALAPGQRITLSQLGFKALIGGTVASLLTASIAGMII